MAYLKPIGKYSLRQDWLVETVGAKPGTRILTAETDAKKAANLSAETEFRDRAGTPKAPIPAQQVRGARTKFEPYDWVVVQAVTCELVSARELTGQNPIFGRFGRLECAENGHVSMASCVNSRENALGNCLVLNGNSISGAGKLLGDFQG
jgi:hypothetical protein